jgi:thiamine-monophosphate kinase
MEQRTEIATLGEFGLIEHLTRNFETKNASTLLAVGDDAAVIDHFGRQTVVSTDLLLEGVHFDLMYTPLKHLGYKAIVVNLSDIYAMNAQPTQVTISIGMSNRFSVEALSELYEGIHLSCEKYGVDLIGGDTSSSKQGLIISVTAIGEVAPNKYVQRNTAKKGDLICVSGDLGGAFLGLTILEREKKIYLENPAIQPDLEGEAYITGKLLKPEARKDIIAFFAENNIVPTAMMDISDGLSNEVLHICKQSSLGAVLYEEKIPIHVDSKKAAMKFGLDPTVCALNGGEDYELIFTLAQEDYDKIVLNEEIAVVGYMANIEEGIKLQTRGGSIINLEQQGWNAFKKS